MVPSVSDIRKVARNTPVRAYCICTSRCSFLLLPPSSSSINKLYVGDKGKADVRDDSYVHLDYRLQHVWLINALPFTGSPMRCAPMLLQLPCGEQCDAVLSSYMD